MMALLFNLDNNDKLLEVLDSCNIKRISVDKNKYNLTLEDIFNNKCNNKLCLATFNDEMIIFDNANVDYVLLKLKMNNINIPLKAILTSYNRKWTPLFLHEQLLREHISYNIKN